MTILDKIAENAKKYPDRFMYCMETPEALLGGVEQNNLCWKDLENYSNHLASYLSSTLNSKNPIVVYGHKSPYMIVCFLACVKSGRAYCPVDISVPHSRAEVIIREVEPEVILATEDFSVENGKILSLPSIISIVQKEEKNIRAHKLKPVSAEDIFYIIFTSGSTGTPKGVQITTSCLDHFIRWAVTLGGGFFEGNHYTFINQAPFSFDLSVMDLFLALYTGGTLWALDKRIQSDMKLLLNSLKNSGAGVWVSTPSFADVCLSDKQFSEELLPELKLFLFCGETLTNRTVSRLKQAFPGAAVVNTYGPTESTVAVTKITVNQEIYERYQPLPVGKEKEGTWILIWDSDGCPVPEGERGEIVIAGDTVSAGYWKNEKLTEEKFGVTEIQGKCCRFYRTGDQGYKKDGLLFYSGRMDRQVKLHGYRIEIDDIENNLMKLPDVGQAAVLPAYRDGKVRSLTAYVSVKRNIADGFKASQKIRSLLARYLPEYMIPKRIIFLDKLPMTINGKIDRKALEGMKP